MEEEQQTPWNVLLDKGFQRIQEEHCDIIPKKNPPFVNLANQKKKDKNATGSDRVMTVRFFGWMKNL